MNESGQDSYSRLIRNVAWLGGASIAVKPLWVVFLTVACARVLGAEGYGVFTTALSLVALCLAFADLGLGPFTVREIAADRSVAARLYSNFVVLRAAVGITAVVLVIGASYALGHDRGLFAAVGIACAYQMASVMLEYARVYFQAFEVLVFQAASVVAEKVLVIAAGLAALLWVGTPQATLAGMAIAMCIVAAGTMRAVHTRLVRFEPSAIDRRYALRMVRTMLPFGASSILAVIFFRIDTVLVEAYLGATAAGQYGYAFRIVEALNLLPLLVLDAAAFPRLSKLASAGSKAEFRRVALGVGAVLLVVSIPVAAALSATSGFIVAFTTSDPLFGPAAPALAALCWVFPLTCVRHLGHTVLLATGKQHFAAAMLGAAVAFNLALNMYLIPRMGVLGAVYATIASEAMLASGNALGVLFRRLRASQSD